MSQHTACPHCWPRSDLSFAFPTPSLPKQTITFLLYFLLFFDGRQRPKRLYYTVGQATPNISFFFFFFFHLESITHSMMAILPRNRKGKYFTNRCLYLCVCVFIFFSPFFFLLMVFEDGSKATLVFCMPYKKIRSRLGVGGASAQVFFFPTTYFEHPRLKSPKKKKTISALKF
ncbi:MAG: hypothetical protein BYD32DRAFT_153664 [Podila humilis]|nr:MAG: hypothetical protein BYD32DRAFT_153664 [Podila humilis]